MLLAKTKLNAIDVLISKVLIDFNILIMINLFQLIMCKENVMRRKKNIKTSEHGMHYMKTMETYYVSCKK